VRGKRQIFVPGKVFQRRPVLRQSGIVSIAAQRFVDSRPERSYSPTRVWNSSIALPPIPTGFTETFLVDSWIEYLRQRERMTAADRMLRDHVWERLAEGTQPSISHMIYAREPASGPNS